MKLNQVEIGQVVKVRIGKRARLVKVMKYIGEYKSCVAVLLMDDRSNGELKGYNGDFEVVV